MKIPIKFTTYGIYGIPLKVSATANVSGTVSGQHGETWDDVRFRDIKTIVFLFPKHTLKVGPFSRLRQEFYIRTEMYKVFPSLEQDFIDAIKEKFKIECNRLGKTSLR